MIEKEIIIGDVLGIGIGELKNEMTDAGWEY
jgi:hypothetical protein